MYSINAGAKLIFCCILVQHRSTTYDPKVTCQCCFQAWFTTITGCLLYLKRTQAIPLAKSPFSPATSFRYWKNIISYLRLTPMYQHWFEFRHIFPIYVRVKLLKTAAKISRLQFWNSRQSWGIQFPWKIDDNTEESGGINAFIFDSWISEWEKRLIDCLDQMGTVPLVQPEPR